MYLMELGRESIIFVLLLFLFFKTKIVELKGLFSIVTLIHLYKTLKYFHEYYINTLKHTYIYSSLFIILLYSLYKLIKNNNKKYFIMCFIGFRIITSRLSNYKEIARINNNMNLLVSLLLFILYKMYHKYKYRDLFLMDLINHSLLFVGI